MEKYEVRSNWPPLLSCLLCKSLIWFGDQDEHDAWHNRLASMQIQLSTRR